MDEEEQQQRFENAFASGTLMYDLALLQDNWQRMAYSENVNERTTKIFSAIHNCIVIFAWYLVMISLFIFDVSAATSHYVMADFSIVLSYQLQHKTQCFEPLKMRAA